MKNLVIIFLLFVSLGSCKKDFSNSREKEIVYEKETELKSGILFSNNDLSIQLDSVTSDSRCPINAECIWEGNATLKFIVTISDTEHKIVLNTNGASSFSSDTILQAYNIALTDLKPYPSTDLRIEQEEYEATIIVKEL